MTTSLDTHYGMALVWDIIHSSIYSINHFYCVIYWANSYLFQGIFIIMGIYAPTFCPLLIKFSSALRQRLVYLIKCYIVGSKTVDQETTLFISSSSWMDGDSNIEQVIEFIINLLSRSCFNNNFLKTSFGTYSALLFPVCTK